MINEEKKKWRKKNITKLSHAVVKAIKFAEASLGCYRLTAGWNYIVPDLETTDPSLFYCFSAVDPAKF